MRRIYADKSIFDLENLVEARKDDRPSLISLKNELEYRKTKRAATLKELVERRLTELTQSKSHGAQPEVCGDPGAGSAEKWRAKRGQARDKAGAQGTLFPSNPPAPATPRSIGANDDEDAATPFDDRRRPKSPSRMRPPGTVGLPDAWTARLGDQVTLSTAADAPRPALYVEALAKLVEEIKRAGAGQKRFDLEKGMFLEVSGERNLYSFPFAEEGELFEDAQVELEVFGRRHDATIVTISEGRIVLAVDDHFGDEIKKATILVDQTGLLTALKERLESVSTGVLTLNRALADATVSDAEAPAVEQPIPRGKTDGDSNEAQRKAYEAALERPVTYIWGPPGCGKTYTLAPIVRAAFEADKRVVVCSNTNAAVDGVLYKICKDLGKEHAAMRDGRVLRLGNKLDGGLEGFREYVTRDGIVERLSGELRRRQTELHEAVAEIDRRSADARRVLERLRHVEQSERSIESTRANAEEADRRRGQHERRLEEEQQQLRKLEDEQTRAGRFFGLFRRDPAAIANDIARCRQRISDHEAGIRQEKTAYRGYRADLDAAQERRERLLRDTAGLDRKAVQATIETAETTKQPLLAELREVDAKLAALETEIVKNARILGATCTKAYLSAKEIGQADMVVIDEASMVMLPALWFCAGLARERVVVCGDFRQIPPIVSTREQAIFDAIGKDVFTAKGIDDADNPQLMLLNEQHRMDDAICRLLSGPMYDGRLLTSQKRQAGKHERLPAPFEGALVVVDTSDLWPFESRDAFFSRFNLMHALLVRNIAWHCRERDFIAGAESLGVCTPYAAQAKLTKALLDDDGLAVVDVGTVHRFQGGQREAIILEIPESHGGPRTLGQFVQGIPPASTGARLINVGLSRAKNHAIVIANLTYLDRYLPGSSLLRDILCKIQKEGRVVPGSEVLALRPIARDLRGLFDAAEITLDDNKLGLFDQDDFDEAFEADLKRAESSIVIFSGFVTPRRVGELGDLLRSKIAQGVAVRCVTRPPNRNGTMRPELGKTALNMLEGIGCVVDCRAQIHEKIAIIDRRVVWHGSLNALSHAHLADESMTRLASAAFSRAVVAKMAKHPYGPDRALAMLTEPENPRCGDCGGRSVFIEGRHGPFFACEEQCGWRTSLDRASAGRGQTAAATADLPNIGPPCPECGGETRLRLSRHGPFYGCNRYPDCQGTVSVAKKGDDDRAATMRGRRRTAQSEQEFR